VFELMKQWILFWYILDIEVALGGYNDLHLFMEWPLNFCRKNWKKQILIWKMQNKLSIPTIFYKKCLAKFYEKLLILHVIKLIWYQSTTWTMTHIYTYILRMVNIVMSTFLLKYLGYLTYNENQPCVNTISGITALLCIIMLFLLILMK